MKSAFVLLTLTGALVVGVGVHRVNAQIDASIQFTTAFPFTVANTTLPAGTYTVTPDELDPAMLAVRGARSAVYVATTDATPKETPSKTELVFERYGGGYVLKNIWLAGSTQGYEVDVTHAEKHVARNNETPSERRVAARVKHKAATAAKVSAAK
jgi:hypothetical protein